MSVRDTITAQINPKPERKEFPGLAEPVFIARLTIAEIDSIRKENENKGHPIPVAVRMLAHFIRNEDGSKVFDVSEKKNPDVTTLGALPLDVTQQIINAGNEINGIGVKKEDAEGKD